MLFEELLELLVESEIADCNIVVSLSKSELRFVKSVVREF